MLRTAVFALLLPALVSCGGNGDKADDAVSEPTTQAASHSSPPADPTPATKQLSEAELNKVLPTLDDMPAGFSPSKDDSDDEDSKGFLCGADFNGVKLRNAKASVDYGAQEGLSAQQMTFAVSQYDSPEQVEEQVQQFADVVDTCDVFTSDGDTYTVTPMSAGRIGDHTVAVKMTTNSEGFDVTVNAIIVGTGPSLVAALSASAGLTGSSVADLVRLTGETVNQYESAAGIS
jgi:hypothetical protein